MDLISEAIRFAVRAHDGMRRKGSDSAYILHPIEAAAIVGSMTEDPEIIAAALLHDVVEDTKITAEEIEAAFGARVKALVLSETEDKRAELPSEDTWLIRKQEAICKLQNTTDAAVKMLYVGDKLSNIRALERDLKRMGDAVWQQFHQKDPAMHRWYYTAIAEATKELKDTQAWQEYDRLVKNVFA